MNQNCACVLMFKVKSQNHIQTTKSQPNRVILQFRCNFIRCFSDDAEALDYAHAISSTVVIVISNRRTRATFFFSRFTEIVITSLVLWWKRTSGASCRIKWGQVVVATRNARARAPNEREARFRAQERLSRGPKRRGSLATWVRCA